MPTFRSWVATLSIAIAPALGAQTTASARPAVPIPPALKVFDPSFIDKSANACQDFFAFANGAWIKNDTIPAAFSSSGVSRDMTDRNEIVVRSVLDDAVKAGHTAPAGSTLAKLGTFYASCMDSARSGTTAFLRSKSALTRIDDQEPRPALLREIAALQTDGVNVLFNFFPAADPKDAAHYIAWASQGGLGMPDRDYYTNADPASDSLRKKYVAHVTTALSFRG